MYLIGATDVITRRHWKSELSFSEILEWVNVAMNVSGHLVSASFAYVAIKKIISTYMSNIHEMGLKEYWHVLVF